MGLFFTVGPIAMLGAFLILLLRLSVTAEMYLQELEDADRGDQGESK